MKDETLSQGNRIILIDGKRGKSHQLRQKGDCCIRRRQLEHSLDHVIYRGISVAACRGFNVLSCK